MEDQLSDTLKSNVDYNYYFGQNGHWQQPFLIDKIVFTQNIPEDKIYGSMIIHRAFRDILAHPLIDFSKPFHLVTTATVRLRKDVYSEALIDVSITNITRSTCQFDLGNTYCVEFRAKEYYPWNEVNYLNSFTDIDERSKVKEIV